MQLHSIVEIEMAPAPSPGLLLLLVGSALGEPGPVYFWDSDSVPLGDGLAFAAAVLAFACLAFAAAGGALAIAGLAFAAAGSALALAGLALAAADGALAIAGLALAAADGALDRLALAAANGALAGCHGYRTRRGARLSSIATSFHCCFIARKTEEHAPEVENKAEIVTKATATGIGGFQRNPVSFKRNPGSFKRIPVSFKRNPGSSSRAPWIRC